MHHFLMLLKGCSGGELLAVVGAYTAVDIFLSGRHLDVVFLLRVLKDFVRGQFGGVLFCADSMLDSGAVSDSR